MIKKIVIALVALSLVGLFISGCSGISGLSPASTVQPGPEILRKAELASDWQMYQMNVEMTGATELPILLELTDGDKVDGYFYLETGSNIDFSITGASLIYQSEAQGRNGLVSSDRFSFVASQDQGSTYTLNFRNINGGNEPAKTKVFLEIIYPVGDTIFTPLESK